jgi:hypothetical protein
LEHPLWEGAKGRESLVGSEEREREALAITKLGREAREGPSECEECATTTLLGSFLHLGEPYTMVRRMRSRAENCKACLPEKKEGGFIFIFIFHQHRLRSCTAVPDTN